MRIWIVTALIGLSLGTLACAPRQADEEGGIAEPRLVSGETGTSPDSHAGSGGESTPAAGSTADRGDEDGPLEVEFGPAVTEAQKAIVKARYAAKRKELGEPGKGFRMTMHRVMAGEPDDSGWYPAHSTRGGFSVRVPTLFSDYTISSTSDKDGVSIQGDWIMAVDHRGTRFVAAAARRADGMIESNYLNKFIHNAQGKKEVRAIKVDGMEGFELRFEGPRSSAVSRVFRSDKTAYMLIAEGLRPLNLDDFEEGWRFLRSFRLDPTPADAETPEGDISPTDAGDDAP